MSVGVKATIAVAQPPGGADPVHAGTLFLSGLAERGDTTAPILVESMAKAQQLLGDRVTYGYLYDALQSFFGEGGSRALVARVVGPAATKGTLSISDRAGSPVPTVRFDAQNEGAWSSRTSIKIDDAVVANTVRVTVLYDGSPVEVYDNLANPAAIVAALANSVYVRAVDLASATAAPANNPAVTAATPLSSGSDDRASVTASTLTGALARFTREYGTGVVTVPGQPYSAISTALAAHCAAFRRIGLMTMAAGSTPSQAVTAARSLRSLTGAENLGLVYPWIQIPDGAGGVRTIPPGSWAAGLRARAISSSGPHRAPAGAYGVAQFAVGVERVLTADDVDALTDDAVIPVRSMLGGVRLYGWRSLSTDLQNYRELSYADTLHTIAAECESALEQYVGRNIDGRGHLFVEIENEVKSVLEPIRAAEGLYEGVDDAGVQTDPGYRVSTGTPINTRSTSQAGTVNVDVAVRVSPIGELINVTITKVALTSSL